jgi:hypothetical protein
MRLRTLLRRRKMGPRTPRNTGARFQEELEKLFSEDNDDEENKKQEENEEQRNKNSGD